MFAEFAEKLEWCFGGVNYHICIDSDGNKDALTVNYFSGHQNV